jgi:hypothetical protein
MNSNRFLVFVCVTTLLSYIYFEKRRRKSISTTTTTESREPSILQLVGHTPLIELKSLSAVSGCKIFAKLEYLNPGGSTKDRVCLQIINDAERAGKIRPGETTLYEVRASVSPMCDWFVGLIIYIYLYI